jgi:pimeloyl-ACP methyl ester carboxylesterase
MRIVIRVLSGLAAALVLLVVLALVAGARYTPNTQIPRGFVGKHVLVAGVPLRVVQRGQGPDVLLIHGSPGSIEDWSQVLNSLASRYRVTAFDRPGHGFSGSSDSFSYDYNADLAIALMDTLKLRDVVVVGHSYGGGTALAMAVKNPDSVAAYLVIDSATYEPSRRINTLFHALGLPVLGVGLARLLPDDIAQAKIRAGVRSEFKLAPPSESFVDLRARIWSSPKVMHALAAEMAGMAGWLAELSPRYPSISRPLFLLAERDHPAHRAAAEHLARDVPSAELELVPKAGHFLQFEAAGRVIATIDRAALLARSPVPLAAQPGPAQARP